MSFKTSAIAALMLALAGVAALPANATGSNGLIQRVVRALPADLHGFCSALAAQSGVVYTRDVYYHYGEGHYLISCPTRARMLGERAG